MVKGSKSLAIASQRCVILKKDYEKMDGVFFAKFIREHFNLCFAKAAQRHIGKDHF